MTKSEEGALWIAATRHHLGGMGFEVAEFCALLVREWPSIDGASRSVIITDVCKAFDSDNMARAAKRDILPLGMDMDRAQWEKVRARF